MTRKAVLGLIGLFLVAYLLPLGARPLFQPDEARYAEIPREMLAGGDWVVPRLDGFLYFEKPVLGYWMTAVSEAIFGHANFACRFPAALSAGVTALAVFLLVFRFGGGRIAAVTAACALLTSGMFYFIGTFNVLDMPLTMFLTGTLAFFYLAYRAERPGQKAMWLMLSGLCCGAAFLTKGFLAFAIPGIVIVPFLIWERSTGKLVRWVWLPLIAGVALAAPWAILIHLRQPDFWRYFLFEEHVRRFFSENAQHSEPFWYFLPLIVAGLMPWTVMIPAVIKGYRKQDLDDSLVRFALCWFVLPFLFFSVSKGKLGTYILPCFPAAAILVGVGLARYFDSGRTRAFALAGRILAPILAVAVLATLAWAVSGLPGFPYGAHERWKWLLALAAIAALAALTWRAATQREALPRVLLMGSGAALCLVVSQWIIPAAFAEPVAMMPLLTRNAGRVDPRMPLVARSNTVHSTCWAFRRADAYLLASEGELDYGLKHAPERKISHEQLRALIARSVPGTLVTVVMTAADYREQKAEFPASTYEDIGKAHAFLQFRGGGGKP